MGAHRTRRLADAEGDCDPVDDRTPELHTYRVSVVFFGQNDVIELEIADASS
jgi:hypothetical protein